MLYGLDQVAMFVVAGVAVALVAAIAREWRPPEVVALGALALLVLLDILSVNEVLGVFANSAPVTIAAMFILSAALGNTGVLAIAARGLVRRVRGRPNLAIAAFLGLVAALSGVMSNSQLVLLMIPVAIAVAAEIGRPASQLLIPVSFAAIVGGTITLIGASTNLLVDGVAAQAGVAPLGVFELAPVAIPLGLAAVVYLTFARFLLPERTTVLSQVGGLAGRDSPRYIFEAAIEDGSNLVGQIAAKAEGLAGPERSLVDVIRQNLSLRRGLDSVVLQPGDVVVLRSTMADLLAMKRDTGLKPGGGDPDPDLQALGRREAVVSELLLGPGAKILGRTLRELRLRRRYGVYPLALHRRGESLTPRLEATPLMVGDVVLVEGDPSDVEKLADDLDLTSVSPKPVAPMRRDKAPWAIGALAFVLIAAGTGALPVVLAALVGATVVLAARCIEPEDAFAAVDWRLLTLIVAMLGLGAAMDKTGLITTATTVLAPLFVDLPPLVLLAAVYLTASVLTEFVSNPVVAVLLTPLAAALALAVGCDPRPFVVAVVFAASTSFLTPGSYQTNGLVYAAGGYAMNDFVKIGFGMNLVCAAVALTLIPLVWPLAPAA